MAEENGIVNAGPDGQLGWIVSWKVPSEVSVEQLRAALATAGLETDLAPDLKASTSIRRALRDMRRGRVIRKLEGLGINESGERRIASFQLTREIVGSEDATYDREAKVWIDLETAHISGDSEPIVTAARELFDEHRQKRMTSDLSRLVQRVFDRRRADLIPIREEWGGAYFVPDRAGDVVHASKILLQEIGGRLRSFSVRLGVADTAESVAESMSSYLGTLIQEFSESCENISSASRAGTIERKTMRIVELRQRLECYQGLLSGYADGIAERIAEAERQLSARIATDPPPAEDAEDSEETTDQPLESEEEVA